MQANVKKFKSIIDGQKQYVIPLFQRSYIWKRDVLDIFWTDLVELCHDDSNRTENNEHFMGAIVTIPLDIASKDIEKYLLIDGQQRLTTILVLLAALRNKAANYTDNKKLLKLADSIKDNYLLHRYENGTDKLKLLPTQLQGDRESFMSIMQGEDGLTGSLITEAYNFFRKKLDGKDIPEFETLISAITNQLMIVHVALEGNDDPYKIFEGLNAKGQKLTQSDLVRNYFFMKIGGSQKDQEEIHNRYWKPMQVQFPIENEGKGVDKFSEYIRHFLMKKGAFIKQGDVYSVLKNQIDDLKEPAAVLGRLKELARFAAYYGVFLDPEKESSRELKIRFLRLNRFQATVTYPFLLNIYNEYDIGCIEEDVFIEILDALDNSLIRRFICNVPTNGLNDLFPSLYKKAKGEDGDLVTSVKKFLSESKFPAKYPRDTEFVEAFKKKALYSKISDVTRRTRVVLARLELFDNKEFINKDWTGWDKEIIKRAERLAKVALEMWSDLGTGLDNPDSSGTGSP